MFAIGAIILVVGALALVGGILKKMRAGRIGNTPFAAPSQIAQNGKGLADAKGSIATEGQVRHGQLLTSPVTNTQCLFYELKLEAKWKVGETEKRYTLIEQSEAVPFHIADTNGQVAVTLDPKASSDYDVTVPFNAKKFSRGLLATMTGKPIEVTPAFSIPGQVHYTELGRQYEVPTTANFFVTERVLEAKPFFHVNGKLQDDGSIGAPKWAALMVKEKNRDALLADSSGAAKKLLVGGGAGAGLGGILAVVGMLTATPKPAEAEPTTTTAASSEAPLAYVAPPGSDEDDDQANDDKPKAGQKAPAKTAAAKTANDSAGPGANAEKAAVAPAKASATPAAAAASGKPAPSPSAAAPAASAKAPAAPAAPAASAKSAAANPGKTAPAASGKTK